MKKLEKKAELVTEEVAASFGSQNQIEDAKRILEEYQGKIDENKATTVKTINDVCNEKSCSIGLIMTRQKTVDLVNYFFENPEQKTVILNPEVWSTI